MNKLILINEIYTNGYKSEVLDIISLSVILCGIFVIISKNPIISILFLIGLFAGIACYLIILGLTFIGLSYLIVYIGAVSILFLFILMLINIRISELQSDTSNSIILAIIIAILFNYPFFQLLPYEIAILNNYSNNINSKLYTVFLDNSQLTNNNNNILFSSSKVWDSHLVETSHITNIGNVMYTNYNMWLIIASFILLLAMVGAIVITIKQKN
jgi:NADH-ubiquinone oxidoreductase chain 6